MLLGKRRSMDGEHVVRHFAKDDIFVRFVHRDKSGAQVFAVRRGSAPGPAAGRRQQDRTPTAPGFTRLPPRGYAGAAVPACQAPPAELIAVE
jgi:hypothetical protein